MSRSNAAREQGIAISPPRRLAELAAEHGGDVDEGAGLREVTRLRSAFDVAEASTLVPVLRRDAIARALAGEASLLVDHGLASLVPPGRRWVHPHAAWVMAALLDVPDAIVDERDRAVIELGAEIAPSAKIGAFAVIRDGARIGADSVIEPSAIIYGGVVIGARVRIGAGAVIGRPGFGWATGPGGKVRRIPQRGGVLIEDDVEVGARSTIDAGTLGPTVLRRGAKLDAQVHVGHNVVIGEGSMVAAQSGFAGSVTLGRGVLVGGQVGVADHVIVGDGARLAAKSGVISDVPAGATFAGYPAVARLRFLRGMARLLSRR